MEIQDLREKIDRIASGYAKHYNIDIDSDWLVMKIQEELGEMVQQYLVVQGKSRVRSGEENPEQKLADELADVFCMTLLLSNTVGIDMEEAIRRKWFQYLDEETASKLRGAQR